MQTDSSGRADSSAVHSLPVLRREPARPGLDQTLVARFILLQEEQLICKCENDMSPFSKYLPVYLSEFLDLSDQQIWDVWDV